MEKQNQNNTEQKEIYKGAARLFCITLFLLVALLCEIMLILPVLAPKSAVSVYQSLGMKRAVLGTLEMQYNRTKKPEDLYNLVVSSASYNDNKRVLKYTEKLLNHKDFGSFSESVNKYALEHSAKDKLYMVASVKDYLQGLRVSTIFKSNKDEALALAVTSFNEPNLDSFYFSYYVDAVLGSKLNQTEKQQLLKTAAETKVGDVAVLEIINQRYTSNLPESLENGELLLLEQLWHTKSVAITLKSACGQDTANDQIELQALASAISQKLS